MAITMILPVSSTASDSFRVRLNCDSSPIVVDLYLSVYTIPEKNKIKNQQRFQSFQNPKNQKLISEQNGKSPGEKNEPRNQHPIWVFVVAYSFQDLAPKADETWNICMKKIIKKEIMDKKI